MAKIIDFKSRKISQSELNLHLVDDYYIMVPELSELSDRPLERVLRDIDKGILKADKINGDLLVPMDMAEEYIDKALNNKLMLIRVSAIAVIIFLAAITIGAIFIAGNM